MQNPRFHDILSKEGTPSFCLQLQVMKTFFTKKRRIFFKNFCCYAENSYLCSVIRIVPGSVREQGDKTVAAKRALHASSFKAKSPISKQEDGCRQTPTGMFRMHTAHAVMFEHIRRGECCFQFISAMVFGDTSFKMSQGKSLRFSCRRIAITETPNKFVF